MSVRESAVYKSVAGSVKEGQSMSIGHYVIGKSIGEGTFGKVRVGTHILTGERVAIKILNKSKIETAADIERVAREIRILKMVRHPHVVQLYEIVETPQQLFLVMEFAPGGELFSHIVKQKRIKELEACRMFQQVISAVEYLHKLGICHRDLKPENLLLDSDNNIKVVDFGLSNMYKPGEKLKTACGSPCYAAPEMIEGKKYVGLQVDIWSSGVVLFAMLAGYLPFEDPHTANLYKKIMSGQYKMPKFISHEAQDMIHCLLNTDPNRRFSIDDIKKHKWYNMLPQKECHGIVVGFNKIPVDLNVAKKMVPYGFNIDSTAHYIECNKHNHATTTYYLLAQKKYSNTESENTNIEGKMPELKEFAQSPHNKSPLETEPQKPSLDVPKETPVPPPIFVPVPRKNPRTTHAPLSSQRREGIRYTPLGTSNQRNAGPMQMSDIYSYIKERLNVSADSTGPTDQLLPQLPHTNQDAVRHDIKRFSMQDRYREYNSNMAGTPTSAQPHVTIFKPNIQNVTIISNSPKLTSMIPTTVKSRCTQIRGRPTSIDPKSRLNVSFEAPGTVRPYSKNTALQTIHKEEKKKLNTSLDATSAHNRLYRLFNPVTAKITPALRQSIMRRKMH